MKQTRAGVIAACLAGLFASSGFCAAQTAPAVGVVESSRPAWCGQAAAAPVMSASAAFGRVAARLARNETITVVAIGSSSTEGSDLPDPRQSYPTHLSTQLNVLFGEGRVRVLNKGKGGETMPETIARFGRDVVAEKPDLVVWQLGVNDVVRNVAPELSAARIEEGLVALADVQAPVVLMDMQFAPSVLRSTQLEAMQRTLKFAAMRHGALLWSRFELMKSIVEDGRAGMADLVRADGLHMTVPMHVCTGKVLGDTIAAALSRDTVSAARR